MDLKLANVVNEQENHIVQKELLKLVGELSSTDVEFCKAETQKLVDLSPKMFARAFLSLYLVDLLGAEEAGEIRVARLVMNRNPKVKSVESLKGTILEIGTQIMCVIIPATVAVKFGYNVTDFDGNYIPEEELSKTVVVIDGQTRYSAARKIRKEYPDRKMELYAYFPLHWLALDKMLQAINLKVFTWMNSDFMTGVLGNANINKATKAALEYIKMLESRGYNYTSSCEWVTLIKGIIKKPLLVKAMSAENPNLSYSYSEFGIAIHKAALEKFSGTNEGALKSKTIPELIIDKWNAACRKLSQEAATEYIISFIRNIENDKLIEMVSPSEYKRGCGKKKEEFVKKQFEQAYQTYLKFKPLKPDQDEKDL